MKKVLVISAHPDDSDFCAAGTIAKLVREGNRVEYLIVSDGSKGSHKLEFGGEKLAKVRQEEQRAAARILGVENVTFLGEVDGEIENTPELRKKLVTEIRRVKPDIVLSFDPSSLSFENMYLSHRDHRIVAEAVFDAIYPGAGNSSFFPELLKDGLMPHQVKEIWFFATLTPNTWIDILETIDTKLQALFAHESQHQDTNELENVIRKRANQEGEEKSLECAECFRVMKWGK